MVNMATQVSEAIQRLAEEVQSAKDAVGQAEANLLSFKKEYNVLSLSGEDRENILTQQLTELTKVYAQAQADRLTRESEYQSLQELLRREKDPLALSLMIENELLKGLREELAERRRNRVDLQETYLSQHPKIIEVNSQIDSLENQIQAEAVNELSRRKLVFELSVARESELAAGLSGRTAAALDLGAQEGEYNRLQREVETRSTVYEYLLQRLQETDIIQELQVNNVQIIDPAMAKKDPVKPNVGLNIMLAVIVGVLGGVSLALFFEYMDNSIKTREEVEGLGLPFLGIIPSVTDPDGRPLTNQSERYLYSLNNPKSAFSEFMRNIRTNILYMKPQEERKAQRILVTSAGPREGKTTTSVNLGITMASGNRRVLLIDADLRRPSLHKAFGLGNERGFSDLLTGRWSAETIPMMTGQKGLFVIPSGPRPPNPAELLSGNRVEEVLQKLDDMFDVVIFDSPPVAAVTDAVVLSQQVDGVVLVVKSFKVGRDLVMQAKQQLEDVNANLYGVALNDFDIQRKSYGYYYYYTYYGQGDEPPKKTRFGARKKAG
jgi:capsular exopolysaccharide synthesis family protein